MAGPDVRWIDSFLDGAPGVEPPIATGRTTTGDEPPPRRAAPSAGPAPGPGGSDPIGVGYLTGPEPAEVRDQIAAAFGTAPPGAPLDPLALWR